MEIEHMGVVKYMKITACDQVAHNMIGWVFCSLDGLWATKNPG
jgi:hypothetical protein